MQRYIDEEPITDKQKLNFNTYLTPGTSHSQKGPIFGNTSILYKGITSETVDKVLSDQPAMYLMCPKEAQLA